MKPDFKKSPDRLVPAIVQDADTRKVLMLGYMNKRAFKQTEKNGLVTFYSRSRKKLWTKGETSGNYLKVKDIFLDCDADTILIKAIPKGPICHTGKDTCFNEKNVSDDFLFELEKIVEDRKINPKKSSYTSRMFARGVNYIVKKFGEESFELAIEAKDSDDTLFKAEAADVLYFFMVMIVERKISLADILEVLRKRRR